MSYLNSLYNNTKISQALTTPTTNGAAGSSSIGLNSLDMADFEGVALVVTFGAITSGAATSIKWQGGDTSSPTTDLLGTSITVADTDDEATFIADLYRPPYRYVRGVILRATQNAVVHDALYIQYNPRKLPTTHGSLVTGELNVSPIAGTA